MKKWILITCALALVAFSTGAVLAGTSASTSVSGKAVSQIKVVRTGGGLQTLTDDGGATVYTDIYGATATIKVASASKATLLVRFSGSTNCYGGTTGGLDNCYVRVLINGTEAAPGGIQFDTNNANTEDSSSYEAHSMEWSSDRLPPGTYTIQVQAHVDESLCCTVTFGLQAWTLAVEKAN